MEERIQRIVREIVNDEQNNNLRTSNQEIQTSNQEFQTVNQELQARFGIVNRQRNQFNPAQNYGSRQRQRTSFYSRRNSSPRTSTATTTSTSSSFTKDVILLPSPECDKVPRGNPKVELQRLGLQIDAMRLSKLSSESELRESLSKVFEKHLVDRDGNTVSFSFVKSCGAQITQLNLHGVGEVSGDILKHIAGQGPIYLRASKELAAWNKDCTANQEALQQNNPVPECKESQDTASPSETIIRYLHQIFPDKPKEYIENVAGSVLNLEEAINVILDNSANERGTDVFVPGDAVPLSSVRQDPSTVLNMFRNRILESSLQRQHLVVKRQSGTIIRDLFKMMKRGEIDPRRGFDIEFENEEGFDAQGLTREYMEIVMTKIRDGTGGLVLFEGQEDHMVPVHKEEYLQSGYFKYVGKAIALSIVQGGVGFQGMSRALAYYIVSGNMDEALPEITLSDVPDLTVQMCLEEMEKAGDEETLKNLEARDDIQFLLTQAGFANEFLTLKSRGRAVQHILLHQVFKARRDEIEDIRMGLDSVNLTEFLMANEHCIKLVFPLASDITYTALQVIDAIASDQHGSFTSKEKEVFEWFKTYIRELEQDQQANCNTMGLSSSCPTLQELIKFIFGDSKLSQGSPIKIAFREAHFPDAESCFGIIYLPLNHNDYQAFRAAMNTCINCQYVGYGRG